MRKNRYKIVFSVLIVIIFIEAIVLVKSSNLENLKNNCIKHFSNNHQRQQCLARYFEEYTKLNSPQAATREALNLKEQGFINQCHIVAHSIGHANLVKNNFNIAKSLAECPKSCLEGCAHGVVENLMERVKDSNQLLKDLPHLCDGLENYSQQFQCIHGIGHGLRKHGEIDLQTAVSTCKDFPRKSSVDSCLDGVFMEEMNQFLGLKMDELKSKLPEFCLTINEQYGERALYYCVRNVAEGLMFYTGGNIEKSKQFCKLLSRDYINQCEVSVEHEKDLDDQE